VEAVTLLLQQMHNDRKLRFFIIGDGAEKSAICDLLSKHQIAFCTSDTVDKLEATVVFTSWRTDMNCVLNGLDIVMLTSLNEGTPVSIMEAMSAGRPVVATNVGGIAEMIQHQVNGFVCNNKQELAAYVKDLIVQPDQRFRMGHAASNFANQAFSIKRQANELDRLYHSLLDLRRDQH
jgi:glycosyltransferase involved in cell wall biosynthesis